MHFRVPPISPVSVLRASRMVPVEAMLKSTVEFTYGHISRFLFKIPFASSTTYDVTQPSKQAKRPHLKVVADSAGKKCAFGSRENGAMWTHNFFRQGKSVEIWIIVFVSISVGFQERLAPRPEDDVADDSVPVTDRWAQYIIYSKCVFCINFLSLD